MNIIYILFYEDLPTRKQNMLRYRMELAEWKRQWREAEAEQDYTRMDQLDRSFNMLGLP